MIELQCDLLAWVAMSRAVLAVTYGGSLHTTRVAVLGSVSLVGAGSSWLTRGMPWRIKPAWTRCRAFGAAVRAVEPPRPAALVGTPPSPGDAGGLVCGLCGGTPVGDVDHWLAAHPLAAPWLEPGMV